MRVSHETKHVSTFFLQKHLHLDLKNKRMLKWPVELGQMSQCLAVLSKVLISSAEVDLHCTKESIMQSESAVSALLTLCL